MSDGLTDKRSQPEYCDPYIRAATVDKIADEVEKGCIATMVGREEFAGLTIHQVREFALQIHNVVTDAIVNHVETPQ